MKYTKPVTEIIEFEVEDIVTESDCGFTQFDAEYCDGVTQAVSKAQFGTK